MKTIYFLKGLPACGKSTWAKNRQEEDPNIVRTNKDELRSMLHNNVFSKGREDLTLRVRDFIVGEALKDGHSVIVDDTNFQPKHKFRMQQIATKYGAIVIEKFFDVPLDECIKRDSTRYVSVGEDVIRKMYKDFLQKTPKVLRYNQGLETFWVIADTHFTHQMLVNTGTRPADYNEQIIANWNKRVGLEDIVVHLGDVIFGEKKERLAEIMSKLNGTKILVRGNHDLKSDEWYESMGFKYVCDAMISDGIMFTHIPQPIPEGITLNIHGHLHGNSGHRVEEVAHILTPNHKLIALELNGYKPERLKDLINA